MVAYHGSDNSLIQTIKKLSRPTDDWGPVSKENRTERRLMNGNPIAEQFESQMPFMQSKFMTSDQDTKL